MIEVPVRMRDLPRDSRGYVVPYFVGYVDGQPDFRTSDHRKFVAAVSGRKCWLCGQGLGSRMTFVLGPMCGLNRTSSEPPCHHDCAQYAVQACPFLTKPRMRRNEKDIPTAGQQPAGIHLARNPGVTLLWVTRYYRLFDVPNGQLIRIGDAIAVEYWAEARRATLDEVIESVESGLPSLMNLALIQGDEAVAELESARQGYLEFVGSAFRTEGRP